MNLKVKGLMFLLKKLIRSLYIQIKKNTTKHRKTLQKKTKENINEYNANLLQIIDHPFRLLIIGGSGSGKICVLLNLIKKVR